MRLLGAECRAVPTNFEKEAGFDPMVCCLKIAASCTQYFRSKCLRSHTSVLELSSGWDGVANFRFINKFMNPTCS